MLAGNWNARTESVLLDIKRDLNDLFAQAGRFVDGLNAAEQLVLAGVGLIGVSYLILGHVRAVDGYEKGAGRFLGILFVLMVMAACLGWTASVYAA